MDSFEETLERIKSATGVRTQVELAELLGLRQSSISDAKRRNSIPPEWYLRLFHQFGLNPDWLSDGIDPKFLKPGLSRDDTDSPRRLVEGGGGYGEASPQSRIVYVSGMGGAQQGSDEAGAWLPEHIGQLAIPETFHSDGLLVVRMEGGGMEPIIRNGAYVGVDPGRRSPISGDIFAVRLPVEGLVLKRLFIDQSGGRIVLRSEASGYPEQGLPLPQGREQIVGRVVWVLQAL
jgi:phage repressor protein C with HTH and peptisase S24 domain